MTAAYLVVLLLLAVYGLHRAHLIWLYLRRPEPPHAGALSGTPMVTVQLPIYNERYVAARLLDAVAALRWPRERLEIQVLDDSTDDTSELVARKVEELRARGVDVHHLRRDDRQGFKAGALERGLLEARGELLLVFDADFVPGPEVLEHAAPPMADPRVGMVQLRWSHLNRGQSALTRAQALLLDGHFVIEHGARHRAGRFFNFSGTAGLWRKAAVLDAGGWHHDTLTEDMDLSYRAQLRGWRFVYLDDACVPAELPADMDAWKSQQFRWAKGQMQVARKLLGSVLRAPLPVAVKVEAFFHLTSNVAYALLFALGLLTPPALWSGTELAAAPLLFAGTLAVAAFYLVAARRLVGGPWRAARELPALMAFCAGLSLSQTRAVAEALLGRASGFVRTPKTGGAVAATYRVAARLPVGELALAIYFGAAFVVAAISRQLAALPFLLLYAIGFAMVGGQSLLTSGIKKRPTSHLVSREQQ